MTVTRMRTDHPWGAWVIVAVLVLFTVINFADKAAIGIAAVPIMLALAHSAPVWVGRSSFFVLLRGLGGFDGVSSPLEAPSASPGPLRRHGRCGRQRALRTQSSHDGKLGQVPYQTHSEQHKACLRLAPIAPP